MAIADEIAQRGHDVDDALTSGVMTVSEFMDRLKIDKCDELRELIEKRSRRQRLQIVFFRISRICRWRGSYIGLSDILSVM